MPATALVTQATRHLRDIRNNTSVTNSLLCTSLTCKCNAASTRTHPILTSMSETKSTTPRSLPPDTPENKRIRSLVVLSFWTVVLLLGLPLWWFTTSIYRAPLPLSEMQSWANGRVWRAWRHHGKRKGLISVLSRLAERSSRCSSMSKLRHYRIQRTF